MQHYQNIRPSGGDTGAPLNLMKRIKLVQRHCSVRGKKILDCGCGTGQYVLALLALGADICGIECSEERIAESQQNHPEMTTRLLVGNIERMDFSDDNFDVVLLNEVLEHIADQARALREIRRVLRPGGLCIVFSPNRLYPFETHGTTLKLGRRNLPFFIPLIPYVPIKLGNLLFEYRARNYWPHELRQILRSHGFEIAHTGYVWQTFENISGRQPLLITKMRRVLQKMASLLEAVPVVRALGVSQFIVARKPSDLVTMKCSESLAAFNSGVIEQERTMVGLA